LIRKNTFVAAMEFSRCVRAQRAPIDRLEGRSLKTQQRVSHRGRRTSRRVRTPDGRTPPDSSPKGVPRKAAIKYRPSNGPNAYRSNSSGIP